MSGAPRELAGWSGSIAQARLINRLTVAFVLDVISIARDELHLLDALLLSTIVQANVAPISRQADLQVAFAGPDEAPPDEMRRPVSINAVATSLGMPFETARRRIRALAARDLCEIGEGGVIVPETVLTSPEYLKNAFAAYERLRAFYYQLRDLGLLPALPPPSVEFASGQVPIRTVARLAADYVLRVIETIMQALGDVAQGYVLLEIFRSNVEHLAAEVRGREGLAAGDFVDDALRRPIRVNTLAERVGLPPETTRRHVGRLLADGYVVKTPAGLVVPAVALTRPRLVGFMGANLVNLQRMFAGLAQLGVLAVWDQLNPRTQPAGQIPQNG